ncbi:MAG: UDP-N-acetylmuramate dehydrogenase [Patescibacteria group bacterium]
MDNLSVEENVSLAPLTTFKVGGPAKYFARVKTETELLESLELARKNGWPVFVLAAGSNLIVSDNGFDGLVINLELGTRDWGLDNSQLVATASASMELLVNESIRAGLASLEWAGGLPGSFGGAIRGNAGCFGGEIKDSIFSVKSIDIVTGQEIDRDNSACEFGYRDSIFKRVKEVIVEGTLQLTKGDRAELRQIADQHIQQRCDRQPLEFPNAGSIFKNIPLERMPKIHLPLFADAIKDDPFPIVPTAKVIAVAGLKGLRVGDAQLSEKHSNYIVNLGQAKAADIVILIEKIRTDIKSKYQVDLEVEPELVGFED